MNERTVLIVRPSYDIPTNYGHYFFGDIAREATELGFNVIDLADEYATKEDMDRALIDHDPKYVFIVTHGCKNLIVGDNFKGLSWTPPGCKGYEHNDRTIENLSGRTVYLLACDSGSGLIPAISNIGGETAFGFDDIWGWIAEPPNYDPSLDTYARSFFELGNIIPISLLKGSTPQEAYSNYVANCDKWVDYWENSEEPLAPFCVSWFLKNKHSLVLYDKGQKFQLADEPGVNGSKMLLIAAALVVGVMVFNKKK